jgi:integrase
VSKPSTPVPVKGHPGVFKKGNRYQVRYRHNERQVAKSFRTLSEAARHKGKIDSGDTQPTSKEPFKSYALRWLDSYTGRTARGLSDSTRASYRDAIERLAVPFFKTVPLERIDPPLLRSFIAHLAKRGLAPASVRRMYAPVRALLGTAYDDGMLRTNPAAGVRVIVKDTRTRTPKWLSTDQTKTLLAEMPIEHSDLCFFLAATGVRISEALGARWGDIGPDQDKRIVLTIPKAKTDAGLRTIPLSPETVRRLTKSRSLSPYAGDSDPIFPSADGTAIDPCNYRREVFRPAAKRAGVPWCTPHKLRHGLASLMAHEGHSAAQIAAHLGHADGGVLAMRTYIHADMIDDPQFIDDAFGEQPC